jgi:hypothetical protein
MSRLQRGWNIADFKSFEVCRLKKTKGLALNNLFKNFLIISQFYHMAKRINLGNMLGIIGNEYRIVYDAKA